MGTDSAGGDDDSEDAESNDLDGCQSDVRDGREIGRFTHSCDFDDRENEFGFSVTGANQYCGGQGAALDAHPRTPKKLMRTTATQKIMTQAAGLASLAPGQKERVYDAAVNSNGKVTSQLRA